MATPNPASPNHAAWGVSETLPSPYTGCVITDWSETEEPQHQYEYDQQGAVIGDVVYDRRFALSLTVQIPKTLTHPKTGTTLTLREKTYIVTAVNVIQNNRDFRKVQLSLERWHNDVTPTDETGSDS